MMHYNCHNEKDACIYCRAAMRGEKIAMRGAEIATPSPYAPPNPYEKGLAELRAALRAAQATSVAGWQPPAAGDYRAPDSWAAGLAALRAKEAGR